MTSTRILLASAGIPPFSSEQESAFMQAAIAENAFARLNYGGLIGDGSKASYDARLVMTAAAYEALCARLRAAGVQRRPTTYGEAFSCCVFVANGQPVMDQELLISLGILSSRCTRERMRDALRFDEVPHRALQRSAVTPSVGFAAETRLTPQARPLGWASLGSKAPTTGMPPQPTKSGWYLRVRLAWPEKQWLPPVGSHSAFGYYDADTKRWKMTSSLDYEYEPDFIPTPGVGGEMEIEAIVHNLDFYPVTMGPVAKARGLTPEQFERAVMHDVVGFEAHYRSLAKADSADRQIFYHVVPSLSWSRVDGNCNTYASYLMASLGVREAYPRGDGWTGTIGSEVVSRNASGDVFIYGSGRAARADKLLAAAVTKPVLVGAFVR